MHTFAVTLGAILGAYALGSVLTGVVLGRLFYRRDPREADNPGGSGSFRQFGPAVGVLVSLLDLSKGVIAVFAGRRLGLAPVALGIVAAAAVAGHNWPLWFHFRGGGGLATAAGALAALGLAELACALAVALLAAAVYKLPAVYRRLPMTALPFGALFGLPAAVVLFLRNGNTPGATASGLCVVIVGLRGLQMLFESRQRAHQ